MYFWRHGYTHSTRYMPINESINNCCFCKTISFQRLYSRFYNFRMYYRGSSFMKISSASWIKTYSCCQKVFTNLFTIKIRFSKYYYIIIIKSVHKSFYKKIMIFPQVNIDGFDPEKFRVANQQAIILYITIFTICTMYTV